MVDISAFGDANERVMGFVDFRLREVDIVGGHQGQRLRIRLFQKPRLGQAFGFHRGGVVAWMALQFHIKPVREGRRETVQKARRLANLAILHQPPNLAWTYSFQNKK